MKIALLMAGQCRQMWLTAPSIYKNVIEPNNADVFLYLHKDSLMPKPDSEEEITKKVFNKNVKNLVFTDDNYNKELKEFCQINHSKVDRFYKKISRDKWDTHIVETTTDQYLKVKKCCEKVIDYADKNNFKYDLICRIRPDIGWLNKFDLLLPVPPDILYINYHLFENKYPWAVDSLFFGSQDVMRNLCAGFFGQMYNVLEIYDEKNPEKDLSLAQEKLLGRYVKDGGIKITGIDRPRLSRYYVDWTKSPNSPLVEIFFKNEISENNSVYFDRIGEKNIVMDNAIILK